MENEKLEVAVKFDIERKMVFKTVTRNINLMFLCQRFGFLF